MFRRKDANFIGVAAPLDSIKDIPLYKKTDDDRLCGEYSLEQWITVMEPHYLRVKDLNSKRIDILFLCHAHELTCFNQDKPSSVPQFFFRRHHRALFVPGNKYLLHGQILWAGCHTPCRFNMRVQKNRWWTASSSSSQSAQEHYYIGWRGPSISWHLLSHCPKVF